MVGVSRFDDDPDLFERYLGELRTGEGRSRAARAVGLDPRQVGVILSERQDLVEEVETAEQEMTDRVEAVLAEAALKGEPWAVVLWLKKRAAPRWGDRDPGPSTQNVFLQINVADTDAFTEKLLQRQAELKGSRPVAIEAHLVDPEG